MFDYNRTKETAGVKAGLEKESNTDESTNPQEVKRMKNGKKKKKKGTITNSINLSLLSLLFL